jgi:hypothetical protein
MVHPDESTPPDLRLDGAAVAYRLFDIGYSIELEAAAALLAPIGPARTRPARGEARAIQIANPPLAVPLGARDLLIGGVSCRAQLAARLFDFGVCSVQLDVAAQPHAGWNDFVAFAREVEYSPEVARLMNEELERLRERIGSAIERPGLAPVTEEYVVFRISALHDHRGALASPDSLTDERLALLLLGEQRPLAREAMRSLLSHRFSY